MTALTDITSLGTILGIWAHPDDESWCSAGVMMTALAHNQRVACITATSGELGTADPERWPPAELKAARDRELEEALKILGVTEHYTLDYPDGGCEQMRGAEAIERIAGIMDTVQPDTILTFGPDGLTGNSDHKTVYQWAMAAAKRATRQPIVYSAVETVERFERSSRRCDELFNIYYRLDQPELIHEEELDLFLQLDEELIERKLAALRAQATQTERMFTNAEAQPALRDMFGSECFIRSVAEA